MPNWCGNTLTLNHDDPVMIRRAVEAFDRGEFLNEFIPCPKDLCHEDITTWFKDEEKQKAVEALKMANREKYGYESWYEFNVAEWGTKWDVGNSQGINDVSENELVVYFDSAWSPPIQAYDALVNQGFRVHATYYEPGSAFAGIYDECGDNCYNLSGLTSDEARDELPPELDDAFGISESMAEYEREEEDEVTTWYKEGVAETGLEPHKKTVDH